MDLARLSVRGFRSLVTVHNTRAGFPAGLCELGAGQAALLVGCAQAVESDLRGARLPIPTRTIWNGIRVSAPAARGSDSEVRRRLGIEPDALVLLALANLRPQKRLHLLPGILAAVRARLANPGGCDVRLLIAGAASPSSELAQRSLGELEAEIGRQQVGPLVHLLGLVTDVAPLLSAADVLVSPSEHEGLSLAHLEALAAGVPVVASGEGGTSELAAAFSSLRHLPGGSDAAEFARAISELVEGPRSADGPAGVARHFSLPRMAAQYARLYPRVLTRNAKPKRRDGVLLVTNNFSLGGAQSSARRLLLGLRATGVRVRAAVIEEQPQYPTPGRSALLAARVPVLALPPPQDLEPSRAVARLLTSIDDDPPEAVLLWNVIAEHKLLIADGLLDIPLFDVSPGEMYFASLQRYFAGSQRAGLPYRSPSDYGARLSGVIVKYAGEAELARRVLGCPVHVIPNGVDVSTAPDPLRRSQSSSPLTIGTAIRIHPDKRVTELLDAVRAASPKLPAHVLRIAGGVDRGAESYAEQLRRAYAELRVEWLGELADPRDFLDTLDVFALVAEPAGCPNASLEAMARGLPIVATDVGGMREQLVPNVTGKLVPRADPEALGSALIELASDARQRAALGRAAFQRARQYFSLERMVEDYRAVCLRGTPV
ncbi:MAG: glycosyltransferase family 4 protein [Polyangiaceae bacterium]